MIFKSFSRFSTMQMYSQACICKKTRAYFCKNVGSQCLSKLTNINNFFRRYSIIIFFVKFVVATEHTPSTTPTPSTNGYTPTPSNEWTLAPTPTTKISFTRIRIRCIPKSASGFNFIVQQGGFEEGHHVG